MRFLKEHKWYLFGIIFCSILLMIPFFVNPYHENDDTIFHVANIYSLADSIKMHGIFGSPILPNLANNFGYASHLLYPPMSHTLSAFVFIFMEHFGLSITVALKFIHVLIFILSGITMYEFVFKISKNKKVAFVASLLYLSFPYHLSDHYVRDSLAELFVFPLIPCILSGIVSLLDEDCKRFYPLFVLGYVGGILSHFTIMIYFTFLLAIFLLIYRKKVFRKEFIKPFLIGSFFVLLITLFFLVPMFEYKFRGGIAVFSEGVMSGGVYCTSLWLHEYLPFAHFHDGVNYGFTLISFLLLVVTCIQYKKLRHFKYAKGFAILGFLCFFFSSKLFYWDLLPKLLYMIQFSWRLCTFLAIGISLFAALCVQKWSHSKIVLLSIVILLLSFVEIHFRCDNLFYHSKDETIESGAAMGWQHEYLPVNAHQQEEYYKTREEGIIAKSGAGATIISNQVPNLVFEAKKGSVLELPRLYYIGYRLENEEHQTIDLLENEMGMIEVTILEDGVYTLTYPGTIFERIANVISLFAIALGTGIYLYVYKQKKA